MPLIGSRNIKLRRLLVISYTALVGVAIGAVGLLTWQASEQAVSSMAEHLMLEIGDRIDQRLVAQLAQLRLVTQTNAALIRRGHLDWRDGPQMEQHFAEQLGLFSGVSAISLATERREFRLLQRAGRNEWILRRMDASTDFRLNRYRADQQGQPGQLLERRDNYDPHNDPPGDPWYRSVVDRRRGDWFLAVSLGRGQARPELVSHYSMPFYDPSGELQGVLGAAMTFTDIGDFLRDLQISANGQAFLIDRQGLLIATSSGEIPFDRRPASDHARNVAVDHRRLAARASTNPITAEATRQLLTTWPDLAQVTTPRSFAFHAQGKRYLTTIVPLSDNQNNPDWLILVAAPLQDFTDLIRVRLYLTVLLILAVLVISILLGLAAAGWISRPLQQLSAATRRLAEGDFSQSLPATSIQELSDLSDAFMTMTGHLDTAFTRLRAVNQRLQEAEQALAAENRHLEERVAARTNELETARTRLEQALAQRTESEAKFRGMFEQSPLGVALFHPVTGQMLEVNERLLQLLGRSRDELLSVGWMGVTHPDDLPAEQACVARLYAGEIDGFDLEKRYLQPDGNPIWVHLTVASIPVGSKDQRLHLCLVENIDARKKAEARVLASERHLRRILDNIPTSIAISTLGKEGQITYLNAQFERSFGYRLGDIPAVSDWAQRAYPDAAYRKLSMDWWFAAVETAVTSAGQVDSREFQVCCKDGTQRDVVISATVLDDLLLVSFLDITARKRAEARLIESEERFRQAFDHANTGMCLVDLQGILLQVNDKMTAIFGYSHQELEGMGVNDLAVPEDQTVSAAFIDQAICGDSDSATFEKRYYHRQGHIIYGEVSSSLVRDVQGRPLYFISQVQDITQRKRAEAALAQSLAELEAANQELHRQATVDALTGLLNRRALLDQLEALLAQPKRRRAGEGLALLFCDLDRFKEINDTLGHAAGDLVLCTVADRIRGRIRAGDLAARMGGDEMVVVLRSVADLESAMTIAEAIRRVVDEPITTPELSVRITASIGVALARPGEQIDALIARADIAMYEAKQAGRNRVTRID